MPVLTIIKLTIKESKKKAQRLSHPGTGRQGSILLKYQHENGRKKRHALTPMEDAMVFPWSRQRLKVTSIAAVAPQM